MMPSKSLLAGVTLLMLAGCGVPDNEEYCRSFGVEGTPEFTKCLSYYSQQTAIFGADQSVCEMKADETYPPTLYDHGGYAHTMGGFGPHGEYYAGQTITIDPDWRKNQEVDRLRTRIVAPCMQSKGWNSSNDWKAGRHAVTAAPQPARPAATTPAPKLPWQ